MLKKLKKFIKRFDITDLLVVAGLFFIYRAIFNISSNLGLICLGLGLLAVAIIIHKFKMAKKELDQEKENLK